MSSIRQLYNLKTIHTDKKFKHNNENYVQEFFVFDWIFN